MWPLFHFLSGKTAQQECAAYPDAFSLFSGLEREEEKAIVCLHRKIAGSLLKMGKKYRLETEDIEELATDCITILIVKIRNGQYVFQGFNPASYVIEIAKNKVRHFKKQPTITIDEALSLTEVTGFTSREAVELLDRLLALLSDNCQHLIRLKYLEELRDNKIIEEKLTQYTTVAALKNHRALCMKKLIEVAKNYPDSERF